VLAAERRLTGTFDANGRSFTRGEFLAQCATGAGASCTFVWADRAFLKRHDIRRWSGPRSLPLWLPLPDLAGFATRDTSPARAAGLTVRPLAETARDTLLWARTAGGTVTGLTADEECEALKAWHASR
jgi:2'-hydroxyisoflavone reductase